MSGGGGDGGGWEKKKSFWVSIGKGLNLMEEI